MYTLLKFTFLVNICTTGKSENADKGVSRLFLNVRKITARDGVGGRKLRDFSRFDDIQNSFSEPTVH